MTEHQQRLIGSSVVSEQVHAARIGHTSAGHDGDGLWVDVDGRDQQAVVLENEAVQPRSRADIQNRSETSLDRSLLEVREFGGPSIEVADR